LRSGRIAAVQPNIAASTAAQTIGCERQVIVPGLIDIHTHAGREKEDAALCLARRASRRWSMRVRRAPIASTRSWRIAKRRRRGCACSSTSGEGIIPEGDLMDIANVDVAATRAAIQRHRDVIVGIKARLSKNVAGNNDIEALRRAQVIARELDIPIMITWARPCRASPTSSRAQAGRHRHAHLRAAAECGLR